MLSKSRRKSKVLWKNSTPGNVDLRFQMSYVTKLRGMTGWKKISSLQIKMSNYFTLGAMGAKQLNLDQSIVKHPVVLI